MNIYEILVLILFAIIFLVIFITYLFHGRKLTKKIKVEKEKPKVIEEKPKEEKIVEQQRVAVGIVREEKKQVEVKEEINIEDIAPFKETVIKNENKESNKQTIQDEIKNLSPEMKKIIMTDILKPKF
ncbi:MAG: hypothetical protein E7359_04575 [Clostridiales bacterium]|nr:hypothetical protein [Clostridiales bacterium]